MTKASAWPQVDRTLQLKDGRQMAYSEWGDLQGRPVVFLHGMPSSRLICPDVEATESAGVRLITMDRPGYGRSDPRPGRTLLDWPDDYLELADQLDLPPCPIVGWSSGGPYALALGFRAPALVATIGLAASNGPIEHVPAGYSPEERAIADLLVNDRAAGLGAISERSSWLVADGWETVFSETWGEADDQVLADPATLDAMKGLTREAARQGSIGFSADMAAELAPWGFSMADIHLPVHVWCGESDFMVDRAQTDYLAESIPGANLVIYAGGGHLIPISHWAEMLAALL
jgi:pimeloyl-ACP methyl ester carboxylesterase